MATITVAPIVLNDVILVVGTDNYEAHVSKVQFNPSSDVITWKSLTPGGTWNFNTAADWTVDLEFAQDFATVNSLSLYLMANEGQSKSIVFKPKKPTTTGPTWTATVIITPGAIGGDVNTVAVATVTLGVQGKPVLTTA
jgi:hypothetical protein